MKYYKTVSLAKTVQQQQALLQLIMIYTILHVSAFFKGLSTKLFLERSTKFVYQKRPPLQTP